MKKLLYLLPLLSLLSLLSLCGCVSSQFRAAGRAIKDSGSNSNRVVIILRDPRSGNIAFEYYRNVLPPATVYGEPIDLLNGTMQFQRKR